MSRQRYKMGKAELAMRRQAKARGGMYAEYTEAAIAASHQTHVLESQFHRPDLARLEYQVRLKVREDYGSRQALKNRAWTLIEIAEYLEAPDLEDFDADLEAECVRGKVRRLQGESMRAYVARWNR